MGLPVGTSNDVIINENVDTVMKYNDIIKKDNEDDDNVNITLPINDNVNISTAVDVITTITATDNNIKTSTATDAGSDIVAPFSAPKRRFPLKRSLTLELNDTTAGNTNTNINTTIYSYAEFRIEKG